MGKLPKTEIDSWRHVDRLCVALNNLGLIRGRGYLHLYASLNSYFRNKKGYIG